MGNNKIIVEFDLGENGGKHAFKSISEIQEWINQEVSSINWFPQTDNNTSHIYSALSQAYGSLSTSINNLLSVSPEGLETSLDSIRSNIESLYKNNNLIHTKTAKAKFIENLKVVDPVVAGNALGFFTNKLGHNSYFNEKSFQGFIKAGVFIEGINTKPSHQTALVQLHESFTNKLNDSKIKLTESEGNFDHLQNKHNIQIDDNKLEFAGFLEKSTNELINVTNTYDKHMALNAPVTYWEKRETHHNKLASKFTNYAGLGLLFGLFFITCLTHALLDFTLPSKNSNSVFSLLTAVPLWKISIVILAISLFIWLERILVRLILSNLHSETDAGERVVMAKTYLSFLREGNISHDEDRKLILASLFRPNSTGIINDDAMPFNLERMQKMVGGN